MTSPDYTHIVFVADRTGSMGQPTDPQRTRAMDAQAGIKKMIKDQAAQPGKITFSLVDFMTSTAPHIRRVAWFVPADSKALADWRCDPYGSTPLLDAVGQTIYETGHDLKQMPEAERPSRVFFVIATDGEENASREYTLEQIKTMITRQREQYKWDFVFIGADMDAFSAGRGMGVTAASTLDSAGVALAAAYAATSDAVVRSRASGQFVNYTDHERKRASGKDAK